MDTYLNLRGNSKITEKTLQNVNIGFLIRLIQKSKLVDETDDSPVSSFFVPVVFHMQLFSLTTII